MAASAAAPDPPGASASAAAPAPPGASPCPHRGGFSAQRAVMGPSLARGLVLGARGCAQVSLLSSQPLQAKRRARWPRGTDSYRAFLQRGNRGSEGTSLPGGSSGPAPGTQRPRPPPPEDKLPRRPSPQAPRDLAPACPGRIRAVPSLAEGLELGGSSAKLLPASGSERKIWQEDRKRGQADPGAEEQVEGAGGSL